MATGDRIGIADKATLDSVNTKASNIITGVNNLSSKMDEIVSRTDSISKDYYTAADLVAGNLKVGSTYVVYNTNNPVVEVTGSGFIYMILYQSVGASVDTSHNIQITVDGSMIYNSSLTIAASQNYTYGILTPYAFIKDGNIVVTARGAVTYTNSTLISNVGNPSVNTVFLPRPIRFSNSFSIAKNLGSSAAGYIHYMYDLD